MVMQTMYFKEHEGFVHNPIGQLSSAPSASWWSVCPVKDPNKHYWPNSYQLKHCSPSVYGKSLDQLKPLSMDHPTSGDQFTAPKQGSNNGTATQFTIFPGDCKNSVDGQKPQAAISVQSVLPEYRAHFELGIGQPLICAKHPYADQCYGVFSAYGPQIPGRIMLPLNLATDDGPIYVNAKQYHGIIRRRKSRAKAEMGNKSTRGRKRYMHESRHLHAMRRPRGCGGRFLNTKNSDNGKCGTEMKKAGDGQPHQPTGSQNSEVLQSDSGTLNTPKEANGSGPNLSGSEVTSMFCRGHLNRFPINYLKPSVHFLSDIIDSRHGTVMPSKWQVAAADNCSNLKV